MRGEMICWIGVALMFAGGLVTILGSVVSSMEKTTSAISQRKIEPAPMTVEPQRVADVAPLTFASAPENRPAQWDTPFPGLNEARKIFDAHPGPSMYPSRIFEDPKTSWRVGQHVGWTKLIDILKQLNWVPPSGVINTDADLALQLFFAHPGPPLYPAVIYDKPDDAWRHIYTYGDPAWARLVVTLKRIGWNLPAPERRP